MVVYAFPAAGIAYNDALYAELKRLGVDVRPGEWGGRWLWSTLKRDDVAHLHWPSFLYAGKGSAWTLITVFLRYTALLTLIRLRAGQLWWTAHNLLPHERSRWPMLDVLARRVVIALAQRIFVHGAEAEKELVARFPAAASKCCRIPHGHWIGHYTSTGTRVQARERLGLPHDGFAYLMFGQCKPYKNVEMLVDSFRRVAREQDRLVIAGSFSDPAYLQRVRERVGADARIRVDARHIPDDEVAAYLLACDVLCMPYREILTSGTTMLALSHGRPVISLNRGFLREVVPSSCGVLVEPMAPAELEAAMAVARERPWSAEAIVRHAETFSFAQAAQITRSHLPPGDPGPPGER